ncbi:FACT complex subunit Ssrp1-like [Varroa jacobsoni]|uniref:FACT complex subunit SSRP1 n=1 Tax=Varroa destructor TaxID=109461 RepID=A0A7M7JNM6_VARDE|nr:FACT complex subunit Ssrp1-like [Varroa destructor]XP_022653199.1 FACT complex subunit Ssrp1-like [Varroa destructor]XP_022653200.1 FACT complex subunit Ssrp1-like [Varroa destructor]XP_022653201.1 FACT complex subunit Ssrp1-like [Varroa destructor]XP_022653202.1 FACT complex subunit Ssrp1-like [Varroa destructor]XP_022706340.1 FACT complex subunit Ssrp1-like [Varroa jacobsoni]
MVNSVFEFGDVWKEDKGGMSNGRLKMTDQNIVFKNAKTGKVDQLNSGEVDSVEWQRLGAGYGMRIVLSGGAIHRFGGFVNDEKEFEKLKEFFKEFYSVELKNRELSLTGRNWGTVNFDAASLEFSIDKFNAFEVPLHYVSNCATAKNEVTLEFHQNDDASINLTEMRFFIPSDANADVDAVDAFRNNVMSKASIIQATGDAIALFSDIQCLTPRGRYDIKIFTTFIQLHGKTFDYKIPVNTILRIFLLPHKDGRQMHFVLSLDPPIKQGQTRYHFLILLFNQEDEEDVKLSMSETDLKEKYEGKLEKEMSGPVFETLSRIVKAIVQRKVTTPGNYKSLNGTPAISCSYKSSYGLLYPLEKGFIYVHKPPVHIRFEEVSSVNFARSGGSTRSFDIEVELRNSIMHTFSSIEKDEYGRLYEFVKSKGLKIGSKQRGAEQTSAGPDDMLDSDQEDDAAPDAYLHRVKREAQARDDNNDDDDDEDESDDDFNPDKASGGSDVAEEYDTDHDSSSSDDDEEEGEDGKKRKKIKTKTIAEPGMGKKREKSDRSREEGGSRKKRSHKKDANAPKRPQTAYFLWMAENRDRIRKENPGMSVTEIAKKGGEEWKALDDKSKWEKMNEELMEQYKKDMEEYKAHKKSDDESLDDEGDKRKKSKKSSPTKASSAGGSGGGFKSKEYISDSSDSNGGEDRSGEEEKKKPKRGGKNNKANESFESLKDQDEEILDSPEASGGSQSGSGSEMDAD